jgi:hypothetical protein
LLCDLAAKHIKGRKNRGISGGKRQGKRGEKKKKMGQNTSKIRSKIQKNGAKI